MTPSNILLLRGYARRCKEGMAEHEALTDLARSTGMDVEWLAEFIDSGMESWENG